MWLLANALTGDVIRLLRSGDLGCSGRIAIATKLDLAAPPSPRSKETSLRMLGGVRPRSPGDCTGASNGVGGRTVVAAGFPDISCNAFGLVLYLRSHA
mmetsp:Transcript_98609/g.306854  ORF Transcript_98609/g.306854 Transcript_98609/m.306854 type:complete len:98 (+) Transcript_98609:1454-1747(+)